MNLDPVGSGRWRSKISVILCGFAALAAGARIQASAATSSDANTAQGRLTAAQQVLDQAADELAGANARNRGGYVEQSRTDIKQTLADVQAALDYVAAHPTANTLANGPAPAESDDLHPEHLVNGGGRYPALTNAISNLNQALDDLVNDLAKDYHGPVLGDLGGTRKKIIDDIMQTGDDVLTAESYTDNGAGAATGRAGRAGRGAAARGARGARGRGAATANNRGDLTSDQLEALVLVTGDYSKGTGFVAQLHDQYFIVTNLHVLAGNKKITLEGIDGTNYPVAGPIYGSVDRDVAIIKIPDNLAKSYYQVQDDVLKESKENDNVLVPGNAGGADVVTQVSGKMLAIGPALVEVNAKFIEGNSGSPIIHKPDNKVIGIATYTVTYSFATTTARGAARFSNSTRWFGVRIDNIDPNQWQELDWNRFSEQSQKLIKLKALTQVMIAFLEGAPLPPSDDSRVTDAIGKLAAAGKPTRRTRGDEQQNMLTAVQEFMQTLLNIAAKDRDDLASEKLYSYIANQLKEQEDTQAQIAKYFNSVSKEIAAMKSNL